MKKNLILIHLFLFYLVFPQELSMNLVKNMIPRNIGPSGMSGRVTAIDVVLSKTIPIPIMPELNQPWNNLDFLEEKFYLLRPLQENKIKSRIIEIFHSKPYKYDDDLNQIIKILEGSFSSSDESFYNKMLNI